MTDDPSYLSVSKENPENFLQSLCSAKYDQHASTELGAHPEAYRKALHKGYEMYLNIKFCLKKFFLLELIYVILQ